MSIAANVWTGTWKLRHPTETVASRTITVTEIDPHSIHATFHEVLKSGRKDMGEVTIICDGKEHRDSSLESGEVMICQEQGPLARKIIIKRGNKIDERITHSLSPNGRVLTVKDLVTGREKIYDKQ